MIAAPAVFESVSRVFDAALAQEAPPAEAERALNAVMDGAAPKTAPQAVSVGASAPLSTIEKTRIFNERKTAAGAFAEIGAGQSVAQFFYQGKQAANTILRAVSAYGKQESNDRYGPIDRFVSEGRLRQMLKKEMAEIHRIDAAARPGAAFFAFADTVTTKKGGKGQGWVGLSFQEAAGGEIRSILLHVKLLDAEVLDQHEALGHLGVNLTYGAYYLKDSAAFIRGLGENLAPGRIEIDAIALEGSGFSPGQGLAAGLRLVKEGLASALLVDPQGHAAAAYEATWGRSVAAYRAPAAEVRLEQARRASGAMLVEVVGLDEFQGPRGRYVLVMKSPQPAAVLQWLGGLKAASVDLIAPQ